MYATRSSWPAHRTRIIKHCVLTYLSAQRGQKSRSILWLQIHRDVRQITNKRRQRLLRYRTRDPEIQQRYVWVSERQWREDTASHEDGDGWGGSGCWMLRWKVRGDVKRRLRHRRMRWTAIVSAADGWTSLGRKEIISAGKRPGLLERKCGDA